MSKLSRKLTFLLVLYLTVFTFINAEEDAPKETPQAEEPKETNDIIDGFTKEDRELLKQNEEKFNFNVEVTRLMDIIINSLYTNKEEMREHSQSLILELE